MTMALASRMLSKSNQLCRWNGAIILPKDRVTAVRYFAKVTAPTPAPKALKGDGDPSTNGHGFPYAPKSSVAGTQLNTSLIPQWISQLNDCGCDFEHWQVFTKHLEGAPKKDEKIQYYIKTLAQVLGSEEEAVRKIYSVATRESCFVFGANVSMETADAIKGLTNVTMVVPDAYDPIEKRYPHDPFVNGQALECDPKHPRVRRRYRHENEPQHDCPPRDSPTSGENDRLV